MDFQRFHVCWSWIRCALLWYIQGLGPLHRLEKESFPSVFHAPIFMPPIQRRRIGSFSWRRRRRTRESYSGLGCALRPSAVWEIERKFEHHFTLQLPIPSDASTKRNRSSARTSIDIHEVNKPKTAAPFLQVLIFHFLPFLNNHFVYLVGFTSDAT